MKNEIVLDVTGASNKTLEELKKFIKENPVHKIKKRIALKNKGVIYCTNYT